MPEIALSKTAKLDKNKKIREKIYHKAVKVNVKYQNMRQKS
jgi:hypothetical protein